MAQLAHIAVMLLNNIGKCLIGVCLTSFTDIQIKSNVLETETG